MKKTVLLAFAALTAFACAPEKEVKTIPYGTTVEIDEATMLDKIRGGWFGQTIGCTYGGPTEFKYKGSIINDEIEIPWYDDYIYDTFIEDPGLYDDVYMDLTFLEVMGKHGIDAPVELFSDSFANAEYKLWHANQAARYNILNGRGAPESGHWMYNPHADDIDFQIEADFIGMITPGLPNVGSEISDRIGHIMNYGDGWYGGVYIGAMYSLAFVCDDIPTVVKEALRTIPEGTKFHNCIADVIRLHEENPTDWKTTWFEIQKAYNFDKGCPEGVWNCFNIDAVMNSAWVVMGLLYGEGDFGKTIDIATRVGDDSDCNPASAAGVLGVMYGYDAIPAEWKGGVDKIADMDFPYTHTSLNSLVGINIDLIRQALPKGGSRYEDGVYYCTIEEPVAVRHEQSFEGIKPVNKVVLKKKFNKELTLEFDGNSIVVEGSVVQTGHDNSDYKAHLQAYLDGELVEDFVMPFDYIKRKYEVFSKYCFESGHHTLRFVLLNPHPDYVVNAQEMVIYDKE